MLLYCDHPGLCSIWDTRPISNHAFPPLRKTPRKVNSNAELGMGTRLSEGLAKGAGYSKKFDVQKETNKNVHK